MITTITYRATNQRNGKWYVGSTVQSLEKRKNAHLRDKKEDAFHRSLRKNPDNFIWEVLSEVETDIIDRSHEQEILDVWFGTEYCYNLSSRAVGMCPRVAKEVGKRSKNFLGVGKLPHIRKLRSDLCHLRHSDKDENGKSKLAVKMGKNAHSRKTPDGKSAVAVENMAKYCSGHNKRGVVMTSIETGEVLVFESIAAASKSLNLNSSHVVQMCKGKRKSHKGYTARYLED